MTVMAGSAKTGLVPKSNIAGPAGGRDLQDDQTREQLRLRLRLRREGEEEEAWCVGNFGFGR